MRWDNHKSYWPNAAHSRFVRARPHSWHVQRSGKGSEIILIHGTGGSVHSFEAMFNDLSAHYAVTAFDLPGHGFTKLGALQRSSLDLMAQDIATLLTELEVKPAAIIGHSAGAALAFRLAETLAVPPRALIGLNAALENFSGAAGWLFPTMAKLLATTPLTTSLFTKFMSGRNSARNLISSTGSTLDEIQIGHYHTLFMSKDHVEGALRMMAQWSLDGFSQRLACIDAPTLLITGANDQAVPPEASVRAAARMPNASHTSLAGLGHLAHEEAPTLVISLIRDYLTKHISER